MSASGAKAINLHIKQHVNALNFQGGISTASEEKKPLSYSFTNHYGYRRGAALARLASSLNVSINPGQAGEQYALPVRQAKLLARKFTHLVLTA